MRLNNKILACILVVTLMIALLGGCAKTKVEDSESNKAADNSTEAVEKVTLKAAHYFKGDHPWNKGLEFFAKRLKEESNGQIEVEIFNNGVLGSETDMIQNVNEGVLDFVVADPSAGSGFAKEMDFFALPFLFNNYEHWENVLDGAPGQSYTATVLEKTDLKIIGYWGGSSRNVLSTKDPILSMDDLKGFKLRLVSSPLKVNVWKAIGTIPTPIAYLETYSALQANVVDGMENESVAVLAMKFYEPAPQITKTEHEFTVRPLFMSEKTFNGLSKELQDVVLKVAKEATEYERKIEKEANVAANKEMEEKYGVDFHDIDKEPFRVAAKPVIEEFAESMELTDLYQSILDTK